MNGTPAKDPAGARETCPTGSQRLLRQGALLVDVRKAGGGIGRRVPCYFPVSREN